MVAHFETAHAIADAIHSANPALRIVSTPHVGLFSAPILDPDLFPDSKPQRGYFVPVPAPPPFKVSPRRLPKLVGESGGRQWSVHILVGEDGGSRVVPTLTVATFARWVRDDTTPVPYLPWAMATEQPEASQGPGLRGLGPINLAGQAARNAVGTAGLLAGRPPIPLLRPPIRWPMILESNDPSFRSLLDSERFLSLYAGWDRRSGVATGPTGSSFPVVKFLAENVKLTTGLDLSQPPGAHAETVREFLELVPELEQAVTGRDPEVDPIATVTFTDPPGSVPDIRPGFRCPQCGRLEILKMVTDPATGFAHKRTLNCGVDIFPPFPDRIRDVSAAGTGSVRPRT